MVGYISEKQLTIEEFKTPFQKKLSADNRWVKLSQVVPWDEFASAYMSMMDSSQGVNNQILSSVNRRISWYLLEKPNKVTPSGRFQLTTPMPE